MTDLDRFDRAACRRLGYAILCSAFSSLALQDSTEAENWIRFSKLASFALTELGIDQKGPMLESAISKIKMGEFQPAIHKRMSGYVRNSDTTG